MIVHCQRPSDSCCYFCCCFITTACNYFDLCQSVSSVASRQHLRSANRGLLVVPRYRLSSYGRRAFSVDMELVTRQYERPGHQQRLLQTFTEDVFVFSLLVYIVH